MEHLQGTHEGSELVRGKGFERPQMKCAEGSARSIQTQSDNNNHVKGLEHLNRKGFI